MLQFDLQFYEELTVAWVRTVKFISGAFFLADRSACLIKRNKYRPSLKCITFITSKLHLRPNFYLSCLMMKKGKYVDATVQIHPEGGSNLKCYVLKMQPTHRICIMIVIRKVSLCWLHVQTVVT